VSAGGRYLVDAAARPFFWLGDTAWLLFLMTTREEAELYFETRARQGFTVAQAAIVMGDERVGGTLRSNVYGDQAFLGGNPANPVVTPGSDFRRPAEYDYWDHVDFVVERARVHGLTLGLVPHFIGFRGEGYRYLTPDRAYAYGVFLGRRYQSQPHVVWILGGDNIPDTESKRSVWHALAQGITIGTTGREDYSRTLMTYHVSGGHSSSEWFHAAPWLDFNMVQVWGNEPDIYPRVMADYQLTPVKPTGLGEGSYEDGPQYPTRPIDALSIRKQAYWSFFAGGYHTYGNTNVWSFGSYRVEVTQDWLRALETAGAAHLSVFARVFRSIEGRPRVFRSIEWWRLSPDLSLFASGVGGGRTRNAAMRSAAGDLALVYLSSQAPVELNLSRLPAGKTIRATWIDPQTGVRTLIGELPASGTPRFSAPHGWLDALLLLEATGAD
jgi:hypothetical protein